MTARFSSLILLLAASGSVLADDIPAKLAPYYKPPAELANDLGDYRSPLKFDDGTPVRNAAATGRSAAARSSRTGTSAMGPWPPLIEKPKLEYLAKEQRENVTQHHIRIETAPGRIDRRCVSARTRRQGAVPGGGRRLLRGEDRRRAGEGRRCATSPCNWRSAASWRCRSAATRTRYYPTKDKCRIQPLSFHAYVAANCYNALANLPIRRSETDRHRRPLLRRQVGDVRVVPVRQVRLRRLVRPRHRLRREARQRQLLGAVVSRLRARRKEQRKAGHPERRRTRAPGRTRR